MAHPALSSESGLPPSAYLHWRRGLFASALPAERRCRFAVEIGRFLKYCEILQVPVSRRQAREYLGIIPLFSARPEAREALRWFFEQVRHARFPGPPPPPPAPAWWQHPPAAADDSAAGAWYEAPAEEDGVTGEPGGAVPPAGNGAAGHPGAPGRPPATASAFAL